MRRGAFRTVQIDAVYECWMGASVSTVARIGQFLVALERLERAQRPGLFLVDRIDATASGVALRPPMGEQVRLSATSSVEVIADALRVGTPDLAVPDSRTEFPISSEPDVQTQWAQLHYALGAYEHAILEDAQVRILAVERKGISATVWVNRGPRGGVETYAVDLDREIDLGLADTIAFAHAYGRVNSSTHPD